MRRSLACAAVAALTLALLPGASGAATKSVGVRNIEFVPATLSAAAGDTITWTWTEGTHNVTSYEGQTISSGNLSAGATFSKGYTGGTVRYRCTLHSTLGSTCNGMCGLITDDTTPPPAPAITFPADGATVGSQSPTITGTASADTTTVKIFEGTSLLATTSAGGDWSASIAFTDGSHTIHATALDEFGNESAASASVTFTVTADLVSPSVSMSAPGDLTVQAGTFTAAGAASDNLNVARLTIRTVSRTLLGSQEHVVCVNCGPSVAYSKQITLLPGVYTVWAEARDDNGNGAQTSARTIVVGA